MNFLIIGAGIILSGAAYYYRSKRRTEKKVITISWEKDRQEEIINKIEALRFGSIYCICSEAAEFVYDYRTYGKLCRWRDKNYIKDVRVNVLGVPA